MTNTASKSQKAPAIRPPREIRDNTKARRAWLATQLADVLAQPDTDTTKTKIVGAGSYQEISVWKLVELTGRERFRGVCQFCGRSQVVSGGEIVLHGYNRPGIGYITGRCIGANHKPLNTEKAHTIAWRDQFAEQLPNAREDAAKMEAAYMAADKAFRISFESKGRADASRPWIGKTATEHERKDYFAKLTVWRETFPMIAARADALDRFNKSRGFMLHLEDMVKHLTGLADGPTFGAPLTREVVVG